jgi:uncharacterized membrane protein YgcG
MRFIDLTSWQGILLTIFGVALIAIIGVGIRVLMMITIQQRQQRMNRQINERLRTLIAAYKVLGGSFTGELTVDPTHLRELNRRAREEGAEIPDANGNDRGRRIRDSVEAALSDIILLGTEEHVRLASQAAADMVAGRPIRTAELVVSLRTFIRTALDLAPITAGVEIPSQGPTRQQGSGGRGKGEGEKRGGGGGGGMGGGGTGGGRGMGGGRAADDA